MTNVTLISLDMRGMNGMHCFLMVNLSMIVQMSFSGEAYITDVTVEVGWMNGAKMGSR